MNRPYSVHIRLGLILKTFLLILLIGLLSEYKALSQHLIVYSRIDIIDGDLSGSKLNLKVDGNQVTSVKPQRNGRVETKLEFNKTYTLEYTKPGYVTKRIQINTRVPDEEKNEVFGPIDFAVELFKDYEGLETVIFDKPVAKIFYKPRANGFTYDVEYSRLIKDKIERVRRAFEKARKKLFICL